MFGKKAKRKTYNKEIQKPVLHCSICTGEQVAGFKNLQTGRFEEVMLIQNDQDLRLFLESYGLKEVEKEY